MRMTYNPAADATYLYLTESAAEGPWAAGTEEVPGAVLDFYSDGYVIGNELLSASQPPSAKPMQISLEILTSSDAAAAE